MPGFAGIFEWWPEAGRGARIAAGEGPPAASAAGAAGEGDAGGEGGALADVEDGGVEGAVEERDAGAGPHRVVPDHRLVVINWLIVEQLTLPEVFTEAEREQLVTAAVERIVAAEQAPPARPSAGSRARGPLGARPGVPGAADLVRRGAGPKTGRATG